MLCLKKTSQITVLVLFLFSINACYSPYAKGPARKGWSDRKDEKHYSERQFTAEEINALKKTTTLFLLGEEDEMLKEAFHKAIKQVWDFTEIRLIPYRELDSYIESGEQYSYFVLEGYNTTVTREPIGIGRRPSNLSYDNPHIYLTLKLPKSKKNKKGEQVDTSISFCRIELFPDTPTIKLMVGDKENKDVGLFYSLGYFKNWTPGMLQLYLAEVNQQLTQNKRAFLYEDMKDKAALKELHQDTLYMPDYVLVKFNKWNGNEDKVHDLNQLMKPYPYPYKVLPADSLSNKIIRGEVKYVFDYIKSSSAHYTRVYEVDKGKIYQFQKFIRYNLKPKDFRKMKR